MDPVSILKNIRRLGDATLDVVDAALSQDLYANGGGMRISVVREADGREVLSVRQEHIETGYEVFVHPTCVWGEDAAPLFVTREGPVRNLGRIQSRETIVEGSPRDVEAYVAARADLPVRVEIAAR